MRRFFGCIGLFLVFCLPAGICQTVPLDQGDFLNDTTVLHCTLVTNLDRVLSSRREKGYEFTGNFIVDLPDGTKVNDRILLEVAGNFRLQYCFVPPIKLKFNYTKGSILFPLKQMRLVNTCKSSGGFDQYLLKEYLIYKIYNLLTDKSYRVRLIELNLKDSSERRKPITEFAFLQEDIKNVAKRNHCRIWEGSKISSEATNHHQMTQISLFEYMIGNTDWAVIAEHNIKLISYAGDSSGKPFPVPYDFDYSGLVNAFYAVPDEKLNFESVKQRQYLGYARSYNEIESELNIFREKKAEIYSLINHFELLTLKSREEMTDYLDEFYKIAGEPEMVKYHFIENVRAQ
jgi:hypothetical protein